MSWIVSIAYIETFSDGTYQPIRSGRLAYLVAADREVSDLIAWYPEEPNIWWLRRNIAPILNPVAIDRAAHFDEPLRIYATPWDWLSNKGKGIVVLDKKCAVTFWLTGISRILVQDQRLANRISAAYKMEKPVIRVEGSQPHAN